MTTDYKDHTIYVTIKNQSSQDLLDKVEDNDSICDIHGKYEEHAATNIDSGNQTQCIKEIRDGATVGPQGNLTYKVSNTGLGTISFVYHCPYSGGHDDEGYAINNSPVIRYEVYGNNDADCIWTDDPSNWGTEGNIPTKGAPLSLLFVVKDA